MHATVEVRMSHGVSVYRGAIKFGSNTGPGQISDIVFDNLTIWSSNGGMKIQERGGGATPSDM